MLVKLQVRGRDTSDPRVDDLLRVRISFVGWYSSIHDHDLSLRMGEYQIIGAALLMGAEKTQGHLTVEVDMATTRRWTITPRCDDEE